MIILTAKEADKVRGISPSDRRAALDPIPLKDGAFVLGEHVLDDPVHADVKDFLSALPTVKDVEPALVYGLDESKSAEEQAEIAAKAIPDYKAIGTRNLTTPVSG